MRHESGGLMDLGWGVLPIPCGEAPWPTPDDGPSPVPDAPMSDSSGAPPPGLVDTSSTGADAGLPGGQPSPVDSSSAPAAPGTPTPSSSPNSSKVLGLVARPQAEPVPGPYGQDEQCPRPCASLACRAVPSRCEGRCSRPHGHRGPHFCTVRRPPPPAADTYVSRRDARRGGGGFTVGSARRRRAGEINATKPDEECEACGSFPLHRCRHCGKTICTWCTANRGTPPWNCRCAVPHRPFPPRRGVPPPRAIAGRHGGSASFIAGSPAAPCGAPDKEAPEEEYLLTDD